MNGILPGFEDEVERMLDEYGEVLTFHIPKSARDKCASGDFRMLYGIATFRNKLHAEDAIRGMTDRSVGPPTEQRKLKLRWDRTADAAPDTNPIPVAQRGRPWEQRENSSYASRPPMNAPSGGGGGGGSDWPRPEPIPDRQDDCSIFVQNLLFKYQEDAVGDFFADKCGPVKWVTLKRDADGKSRGFGFVEFATQASRDQALDTLNGVSFGGRMLAVKKVVPRDGSASGGGAPRSYLPPSQGPRDDSWRPNEPPRSESRFSDRPPGNGNWDNRQAPDVARPGEWRGDERGSPGGGGGPGRHRNDDRPLPY